MQAEAIIKPLMERFREPTRVPWNRTSSLTLFSLLLIWVFLFSLTWGRWGNVTIDSGREMYVPSALASGKTLYVDVWYPYTPAAPYLNAVLFRLLTTYGPASQYAFRSCVSTRTKSWCMPGVNC